MTKCEIELLCAYRGASEGDKRRILSLTKASVVTEVKSLSVRQRVVITLFIWLSR